MQTTDEILAVVQAFKDGREIQFQEGSYEWEDCECPNWNFRDYSYRVKPEPPKPREFWLVKNGYQKCPDFSGYDRKQDDVDNIHVREVLPRGGEASTSTWGSLGGHRPA